MVACIFILEFQLNYTISSYIFRFFLGEVEENLHKIIIYKYQTHFLMDLNQ